MARRAVRPEARKRLGENVTKCDDNSENDERADAWQASHGDLLLVVHELPANSAGQGQRQMNCWGGCRVLLGSRNRLYDTGIMLMS